MKVMSESVKPHLLHELERANRVAHRSGHGAPVVPGASLIGLWLLLPLALAGLAVVIVGLAMLLESHRTAPDLPLDWRPWLALTLALQLVYWTGIARLGGRSWFYGLWALLPGVALVPTFFIARDALMRGRIIEPVPGSRNGAHPEAGVTGEDAVPLVAVDVSAVSGVAVEPQVLPSATTTQPGGQRGLGPLTAVVLIGVLLFAGTAFALINARTSLHDCMGEPEIVEQQSDYLTLRRDQEAAYQEFVSGRLSYEGYREYVVRTEEVDRSLSAAIAACLAT